MAKTMIRNHSLFERQPLPQSSDIEPRPLIIEEVKKVYIKV